MCGRACCSLAPDVIQKTMGVSGGRWRDKDKYDPGYNLAPGAHLPVVYCTTGNDTDCKREMASMKWGLVPFWSKVGDNRLYKMSNARAETLKVKRSYKDLIPSKRCVVVIEGYFEWECSTPSPGVQAKQPFFFQRPDRKLLALAGLYDCWKDSQGNELLTFTMITTAAAPNLAWCHERMPVILDEAGIEIWLRTGKYSSDEALAQLKPDPGLEWYPVPSLVGNVNNNSPECIQRLELRAKRSSPSSSPQRPQQPRSPVIKQPRIESFIQSIKRGDESGGVKPERSPSSSSSFSTPSLPPPTSPYRAKLEPQDRRIYASQRTSSASPSSSSPSTSSRGSSVSSSALSSSPLLTPAAPLATARGKRKRDDDGEVEVKADESDRSSKVCANGEQSRQVKREHDDDDDEEEGQGREQELYIEQSTQSVANGGKKNDVVVDDCHTNNVAEAGDCVGAEPWDEDSFPYYLVDDPTLEHQSSASSSSSPSSSSSCPTAVDEPGEVDGDHHEDLGLACH